MSLTESQPSFLHRFHALCLHGYQLLRTYTLHLIAYLKSEQFLVDLALAPLFFSWIVVLTWKYEVPKFRSPSFYGILNSILFFGGILIAWILSWIPFLGDILGLVVHSLVVCFYWACSGFLIYSHRKEKKISLPVLSDWHEKLSRFAENKRL